MATLSDAIKEHGFVNDGFVCDECHNVLLYWDRAKGEFWGRGADPKQHYPVGSVVQARAQEAEGDRYEMGGTHGRAGERAWQTAEEDQ